MLYCSVVVSFWVSAAVLVWKSFSANPVWCKKALDVRLTLLRVSLADSCSPTMMEYRTAFSFMSRSSWKAAILLLNSSRLVLDGLATFDGDGPSFIEDEHSLLEEVPRTFSGVDDALRMLAGRLPEDGCCFLSDPGGLLKMDLDGVELMFNF